MDETRVAATLREIAQIWMTPETRLLFERLAADFEAQDATPLPATWGLSGTPAPVDPPLDARPKPATPEPPCSHPWDRLRQTGTIRTHGVAYCLNCRQILQLPWNIREP